MPDEIESKASHVSGGAYTGSEKIGTINVADEISNSFLDYSMSVIISRALPDVRDGLKPSQRRILYAMHELSLFPGRKPYKCAKICGDTSGNYHPHGEAVIYPTLVHMAQPWAMRERLVAALSTQAVGKVDIVDGFFDALPVPDASADLVVACSALERDAAHGGAAGLAEMERVCTPDGLMVVVWPSHLDWLSAQGFTYLSFPGRMWMEFRDPEEAIEMTEIFYPHAAAEVRARGEARVEYDVIGVNPPRDLAFKVNKR